VVKKRKENQRGASFNLRHHLGQARHHGDWWQRFGNPTMTKQNQRLAVTGIDDKGSETRLWLSKTNDWQCDHAHKIDRLVVSYQSRPLRGRSCAKIGHPTGQCLLSHPLDKDL